MRPLLGKADSAAMADGITVISIAQPSASEKGRIEEMYGADAQKRNFMRYFTLITKYAHCECATQGLIGFQFASRCA